MTEFAIVMGLAALPALANFAGGALAELFSVSAHALSLALHLAAGIVLAVVGLELMPEALNSSVPWLPLLAFVAGGAVFIGLDRLVGYAQGRFGGDEKQKGALAIFGGVSVDLFSDGVMIGTGTVVNPALGLLLALGQMPADAPEGFAAVATMRNAGIKRRTRLLLTAGFRRPDPRRGGAGLPGAARRPRGGDAVGSRTDRRCAGGGRGRGDGQRGARG